MLILISYTIARASTYPHAYLYYLQFSSADSSITDQLLQPHNMATLADLKSNGPFWWRVHVFTYDLRFFSQREDSHKRLEAIVDASYLGLPYFSADEVLQLKSTTLDSGKTLEQTVQETLDERLNRRMKKRQESEDYRVCAAHDLAPIFEKAFSLDPKKLDKSKEFVERLNERGLQGGEDWTGLPNKPICGPKIPPGKNKKKGLH